MTDNVLTSIAERLVQAVNEKYDFAEVAEILTVEDVTTDTSIRRFIESIDRMKNSDYTNSTYVYDRARSEKICLALVKSVANSDSFIFRRDPEIKIRQRLGIEKLKKNRLFATASITLALGSSEIYYYNGKESSEAIPLKEIDSLRSSDAVSILNAVFNCSTMELLPAIIEHGSEFDFSLPIDDKEVYEIFEREDEDKVHQIIDDAVSNSLISLDSAIILVLEMQHGAKNLTSQDLSSQVTRGISIDLKEFR